MQFIKQLIFLVSVVFIASCSHGTNDFSIKGTVKNMPEQTVMLEELSVNAITVIDSARSDNEGHFTLKGNAPEPSIYRLRFSDDKYLILSIESGSVTVNADWSDMMNATTGGSPSSASLMAFLATFRGYVRDIKTISEVARVMKEKGNDSLLNKADQEMAGINKELTTFIENYADSTMYEPNAVFAIQILNSDFETAYLRAFIAKLPQRFPNTRLTKDLLAKYPLAAAPQPAATGTNQPAPDFTLPTPDGREVSLSSFKGKYVLVDFWASWCGPCRGENPNVVAAYKQYKSRNFEILGVSLDSKRENWLDAIHSDGLVWTQVSDLKGWESAASKLYHIESIPSNVLIDPNGNIIATDLRGEDLQTMLEKTLPQQTP